MNKEITESVDDSSLQGKLKHYILHPVLVKPNKKTKKLRILYDASIKTKKSNVSLNECLHHGPVILKNLCAMFVRFLSQKVALVAEMKKHLFKLVCKKKTGMLHGFHG